MKIRKIIFALTMCFLGTLTSIPAQTRHALLIGNTAYQHIDRLENPINDANAIAAKLQKLGWQVELKTNVGIAAMGQAISGFMRKLASSRDNEGFFWYAGHGVEINGENYLLPVDIGSDEDSALYSSYRLNNLLDQFEKTAKNKINIVVLDACRNNPFASTPDNRRGSDRSRGLVVVEDIPQSLYIMYSTAPRTTAYDGRGKQNSPFAEAFLKHIENSEPFIIMTNRVALETQRLTGGSQRPWHSGSFIAMPDYSLNLSRVTPVPQPTPQPIPDGLAFVRINAGMFSMGGTGDYDGKPIHQVTIGKPFYIGKYEVTQREWVEVMGSNPSSFKGDNLPVERVSWYDAIEYCNKRSQKDGLTPAYTISGTNVTWNRSANGYRLPTEAEWEYACRAGTTTWYSSGNSVDTAGWHGDNSGSKTHPVGTKQANAWGLYDMHGNVWEWCWDWYGNYPSGAQTDPLGATSGSGRVYRGGGWNSGAADLRSASRSGYTPTLRGINLGFRLVRP